VSAATVKWEVLLPDGKWVAAKMPLTYRPAVDPYEAFKAALAAGKPGQFKNCDGVWVDVEVPANLSFCYPPENYRVKPEPALPKHLPAGTRVWVYPKTEHGYEATVERFRPNVFDPNKFVYEIRRTSDGFRLGVPSQFVVEFDENHNQKRAHAQGKTLQYRIKGSPLDPWRVLPAYEKPLWMAELEYRVKPAPVIETARCQCTPISIGSVDSEEKVYVQLDATRTDGVVTNVKLATWEVK
jgi:hypothetical protein